jgi:hypothetical protein
MVLRQSAHATATVVEDDLGLSPGFASAVTAPARRDAID